tara:strand:+ start:138 stop:614 length:477 start_codon:yes stop_codon:yes gene_type:complete
MVAKHPQLKRLSDKAVLFALRNYMDNKTGYCYPTEMQIAASASACEKTVRKSLKKAVDLGIIERRLNNPKSGKGYKNYSYIPLIPGEVITGIKKKPPVTDAKPPVNQVKNHRNAVPPNYKVNYLNNYNDSNIRKEGMHKIDTKMGIQMMKDALGNKHI